MSNTLIVVLITVGAVAFFVLAMSLTLIFKGKNLQSEVGENDEMKKRGIKCTQQVMREEEAAITGTDCDLLGGCGGHSCSACEKSE